MPNPHTPDDAEIDPAGNTPLPEPDLPPAPTGEVVDVSTDQPPTQKRRADRQPDGGLGDSGAE